jgi:glycosyltransferase involved in cell wall biosynthesis
MLNNPQEQEFCLVISSHIPSLKIPQAGHKSAYMILENLSKKYKVILIAFQNSFEKKYYNSNELFFCEKVNIFEQSIVDKVNNILMSPMLPLRVATRKNSEVVKVIEKYLKQYNFKKIHFEFTSSMVYLDLFLNKNIYLEVSEHDITYQAFYRKYQSSSFYKKLFYKFEFERFKQWELQSLKKMHKIIVHNTKDADILYSEDFSKEKITVIKPYVNPIFKNLNRNKKEDNSLIFWGAMNRIENEDAILWFLQNILPKIQQKNSDIKIYIVGNEPSEKLKKFKNDQILITGFVENPIEYFEKASLAIAPLRIGAGIKVKVLESLAAGLKVISTDVGAEGIQDENLIIANTEEEFSNKVLRHI